jgi:hypothetical protein
MNEREEMLLEFFRRLAPDDQDEALDYMDWLVESVEERKGVGDGFFGYSASWN